MLKKIYNSKRFIAMLILICIVVTALLSISFIISHSNHDCIGESCPVCARINYCISILNNIAGLNLIFCLLFACSMSLTYTQSSVRHFSRKENTPVGLKVQMNN
jgi:cell division protein FtsL